MHIEILKHPHGDVIAHEDASSGKFVIRPDGSVWYENSLAQENACFVNTNMPVFLECAAALNQYTADIATTDGEPEQLEFVRRLTVILSDIGVLPGSPDSFWPLIIEQAEDGLV